MRRPTPQVSVLLVTHNRLRMLQKCLSSLLDTTEGHDIEILVWDNASDDGTRQYLDELKRRNDVLRVIHSRKNVGLNAVALSVRLARGFYLVELDDDVLRFPTDWLPSLLAAFRTIPRAGYLAADVVQDDMTNGAKFPADAYRAVRYGDTVLEQGPTGAGAP